jgi:sterol desaturase/sphingolipid hydroxylase (fatty acid hydroxylase superfamily)
MSIYLVLAAVMALNGIVLGVLQRLGDSSLMTKHRKRKDWPRKVEPREHSTNRLINAAVSTLQIFTMAFVFNDWLFTQRSTGVVESLIDAACILALYDFGYYLVHRFVFHQWRVGRKIHALHHRILSPYVQDSIFIHPAETVAGLCLFFGCAMLVGPVSIYSFGFSFFIYSAWNLFIHSAFHLPFFPFRTMSSLVTHHDLHHRSMKAGYYASLTPIYDHLFGTATEHKKRAATTS